MEAAYFGIGQTVTLRADLGDFPVRVQFEILADLLRRTGVLHEILAPDSGIPRAAFDAAWNAAVAKAGA